MPSIRRSLLGYLLMLLALALGGVGGLVDRFAEAAMQARERAEAERIGQAYGQREKEAKAKFDADLLAEAQLIGRDAWRSRLLSPAILGNQDGPGTALRPRDEEVKQYQRRVAALLGGGFGTTTNAWPAVLTAGTARLASPGEAGRPLGPPGGRSGGPDGPRPAPGPAPERPTGSPPGGAGRPPLDLRLLSPLWAGYEVPRVVARIHDALQTSFEDDEPRHRGEFEILFTTADPSSRNRSVARVRSPGLPTALPFDAEAVDRASQADHPPDDVDLPTLGRCRVVVYRTFTPLRRGPVLPVALQNPPAGRPLSLRFTDQTMRLYVLAVRPYSELDARLAEDRRSRDEQLAAVRHETRHELALLRTRLGLIGGGTFVALVLGGWVIVARGLFPMRKLSDAVSRVSERDFRLPIEADDLSRELAPIHARLTQTLDMLRRAFAREKQAVADISHELRTPIASLQATLDVALRKPRTPEQYRATLEDCRAICRQLGLLVERIMVLASLDAGTARTVRTRADAADVAAGCAAVIRPLAGSHGLEFASRVAAPLELDTDPDQLREVLVNLLHNAVEYNRPGGRIDLVGRREGGAVVLEVRDTGIGMTSEVRERIFERFYRADASRQATGVHAGLGLAIVKEYVERLGGTIAVESEPGVGSVFRVTLPAPADVPEEPELPPHPSAWTTDEPIASGS